MMMRPYARLKLSLFDCLHVLCMQLIAAIVFVSGAPNWQYKIRMNNSEVPDPSIAVNDLLVSADTTAQDMYLW
jgi:hypothetical protein